jgi:hypothetical protein
MVLPVTVKPDAGPGDGKRPHPYTAVEEFPIVFFSTSELVAESARYTPVPPPASILLLVTLLEPESTYTPVALAPLAEIMFPVAVTHAIISRTDS